MAKKHHKNIKHIRAIKSKPNINRTKLVVSISVLILIAAAFGYLIFKDKAAATVNGEKIYEKTVDAVYNSLPSNSKISKTQLLQQIIDTKLLANYIEKQGFGLSDATFQSELKKLLSSENKSMNEFNKELSLWGITADNFKESMEISIFVKGVLENNADAAKTIIEKERASAKVVIYSKYE